MGQRPKPTLPNVSKVVKSLPDPDPAHQRVTNYAHGPLVRDDPIGLSSFHPESDLKRSQARSATPIPAASNSSESVNISNSPAIASPWQSSLWEVSVSTAAARSCKLDAGARSLRQTTAATARTNSQIRKVRLNTLARLLWLQQLPQCVLHQGTPVLPETDQGPFNLPLSTSHPQPPIH